MWDKDGSRKCSIAQVFSALRLITFFDCEEVDWVVRTIDEVQHIIIEPKGGILPDVIPPSGDPAPWICVAQGSFPRALNIIFQRGSIDNDFKSTVECIFDLVDPRYDARARG